MSDRHDDRTEFLERLVAELADCDNLPDREIIDALIEWLDRGCPPPRISVSYHADRSVTVDRP